MNTDQILYICPYLNLLRSLSLQISNTANMLALAILFAAFVTAHCEDDSDVLTPVELKMTEMSETISKLKASL